MACRLLFAVLLVGLVLAVQGDEGQAKQVFELFIYH